MLWAMDPAQEDLYALDSRNESVLHALLRDYGNDCDTYSGCRAEIEIVTNAGSDRAAAREYLLAQVDSASLGGFCGQWQLEVGECASVGCGHFDGGRNVFELEDNAYE